MGSLIKSYIRTFKVLCIIRAEGVSNDAVEVWSEYRVGPSAAGSNAPVCQKCGLVDCLSRCYSDDSCYAVDYDTNSTACYALNATLTCTSLTPASDFIHVSTAHCGKFSHTPCPRTKYVDPVPTYYAAVRLERTCF